MALHFAYYETNAALTRSHSFRFEKVTVFLSCILVYLTPAAMYLFLFLVCFVLASADDEPVYAKERGFAVGLINRAKLDCKRQTKNGDHISVRYNGTFIDGSVYVPPG